MFFDQKNLKIPPEFEEALLTLFKGGVDPKSKALQIKARQLKELWQELAQKRGQTQAGEEHYSMVRSKAEIYGSYYLPVNFLKLSMILKERHLLLGSESPFPLRWMDLGCGPGTALWGLHHYFYSLNRKPVFEYIGVDQSKNFLSLARTLGDALESTLRSKGGKAFFEQASQPKQIHGLLEKHNPDAVCLMNSFGELYSSESQKIEFFEILKKFGKKKRNFLVVIVEPSAKNASRELLQWRERIRHEHGIQITQPCLDNRACGALASASDWCHEDVAVEYPNWFVEFGKQASLVKESLLFSYLVFDFSAQEKFEERKMEEGTGSKKLSHSRVVSQCMKSKGLSQCFLCAREGRFKARVLDSKVDNENSIFQNVLRGQIFEQVELSEKGDVLKAKMRCEA